MRDFVRELFDTDFCEATKYHRLSEDGMTALTMKENAFNKLENTLEKENLELFKSYISAETVVKTDEIFHAYCCGMRDFVRLMTSLFDSNC